MSGNLEQRLSHLEQQVARMAAQLVQQQETLLLIGDVQRFSRLRQLLGTGQLDAADRETARLLHDQLASTPEGLSPESVQRCAAAPLLIMDALWRISPGGQQGFASQQQLYQDLGGSRDTLVAQNPELFRRFTDRVGWPLLSGVGFALPDQLTVPVASTLDASGLPPAGHLPMRCWSTDYGLKAANLLMARLIDVFAP